MLTQPLLIYLMVYLIPAFILFTMASMVLSKNIKRIENRLVALLIYLNSLLFLEEFVRHLLQIEYSSLLVFLVLMNTALLIYTVLCHFYFHITKLHKLILKIPFYPVIFYIPFVLIVLSQLLTKTYNANINFQQKGIWLLAETGDSHYIFITISSLFLLFLVAILITGLKYTTSKRTYRLIRLLAVGTFLAFLLNAFLGYMEFDEVYPPFPTILTSILFTIFLSVSIFKFQLLPPALERYQTMFHLSPLPIIVFNEEWGILEFNKEAEKDILFYGNEYSTMMELASSEFNKKEIKKLFDLMTEEKELYDYAITFRKIKSTEILHYAVDAAVVEIEDKQVFYTIWRDVTEDLKKEQLIEHMAYHDALTGLHNRAYFVEEVEKKLKSRINSTNSISAVVLIDLNRFKEINDTYGHAIGDQVLQKTAAILENSVREKDLVARMGGDEFILFLADFPTKQAIEVWEVRLREQFQQNIVITATFAIELEVSIGIAYYLIDGHHFEELFHRADSNMYEDKLLSRKSKIV